MKGIDALARPAAFCVRVLRRFVADGCGTMAGSLAYTTLLSLVPLVTVALYGLAALPALQPLRADVEDFLFSEFVPEMGEGLRTTLSGFVLKAAGLGNVGLAVLGVTVILLVVEVDTALARIWGAGPLRRRVRNYLVYLAILIFGPLLVAANLAATTFLLSLPLLRAAGWVTAVQDLVLGLLSFGTAFAAFALVYRWMPHWTVPWRSALTGALAAAVLFELAKQGFAWYVQFVSVQRAIYGAFAAAPLFLVWLYLSWAIVLLGAEITHALALASRDRAAAESGDGPERP